MKWIRKLFSTLVFMVLLLIISGMLITTLYPLAYKDYINEYSRKYNIDPFLVSAIINVESRYDKNAVSHKDARGLMQIGAKTGKWASEELGIEDYHENMLFDPKSNIQIGTWYLNNLNSEFKNNLDLVLAAYNAGSGNVQKWRMDKNYSMDGEKLHKIPFKETEEYLKKVKSNYKIYKIIYKNHMYKSDNHSWRYVDFINYIRKYLKQATMTIGKGEKS